MADTNPFANMGLGMMGNDASYAKQGMSGGKDDGGEFLGGVLSFLGVGQDTQEKIKNFKTNPFAAMGSKTTPDMYGVSSNAMGPAMPPQQSNAPIVPNSSNFAYQNGSDIAGGFNPSTIFLNQISNKPTIPTLDQQIQQQRQQTQDIVKKLIPINLQNNP